jgi:ribosomal protein S18 acetylase RimI-like enzyme
MSARPAVSIRRATSEDIAGILECLHVAFVPYRADYTEAAFADTVLTRPTLVQRLAAMAVFVASTEGGEIVGTIAGQMRDGQEGHIRGMAVHPDWQGCGVAQQLLDAVQSELRDSNCSRISLDTVAPLRRAIHFYQRNGYRPSGQVTDFFGMPLFEYVKKVR